MKYQALYRKYRPKTFDDVYGQEIVVKKLKKLNLKKTFIDIKNIYIFICYIAIKSAY